MLQEFRILFDRFGCQEMPVEKFAKHSSIGNQYINRQKLENKMKTIRGSEIEFAPASHEDPNKAGVVRRVLAAKNDFQSGQVMMLNWSQLPVGSSFRSHFHENMQEAFVIIQGNVTMTVDDKAVDLGKGDAVLVEPREIHSMTNKGDQPAEFVVFGIASGEGGRTIVVD